MALDVEAIREDFPILRRKVNGKRIAYLDNAATSQKPLAVLEAMERYYRTCNANVHRGTHRLSEEATDAYEKARANIAGFINAQPEEIIFTKNATEALNLVASVVCRQAKEGQRILLTQMEHHSNIVPWQIWAAERGLELGYAEIGEGFSLSGQSVLEGLSGSPLIFSFTHISNVLGTINDAAWLCRKARQAGAYSCVDAAQSVPHMQVDVREMGCDFLAFSGHKMLGPMGIGVLYMRRRLQECLPPFLGGGDMISSVGFERSYWNAPPRKYEAGTPNVAGAIGLSAAIDYLRRVGMGKIARHEKELARLCVERLEAIGKARIYGPKKRAGLVSFNIGSVHAHDAAAFADGEGVQIRAGHHCAMPLVRMLGEAATCRASFYLYNTEEEVERLSHAMRKAQRALG
ncbi:MAG: SufS family cysteine desulfurase [Candidatus Micrarchaeota archaeon]|nr:SufS family cysteine desulfurase [Candidatus Micrarchaeota archaeon]